MRTRLAIRIDAALERFFPERRVFLKSDTDTRFIRVGPGAQLVAFTGIALLLAWTIVATSILLMDSIGAGNYRKQAIRERATFLDRVTEISEQRDARAEETLAAQERFNAALEQVSVMQSELLQSETRRRELETGIEVIQATLRDTMNERKRFEQRLEEIEARISQDGTAFASTGGEGGVPVDFLADALARTAAERDRVITESEDALLLAEELQAEIERMAEQNDTIFRQLEEAMTVSVAPLDKMFRSAGLSTERMLNEVRRGYSGQGGPLMPLTLSTRGEPPSSDELRANRLIDQMDRLNLYRIAAERAPFASPVHSSFRFTSPYGYRRDPKTGGRRMHSGVDFAAPTGTPILATADGVVTFAGWGSGYGRLVKIQHDFGLETRYAHLSHIDVKVGQKVSRGDKIGGMGASGRVTGVHLHYEVRASGEAVNPMIYIKAAKNVFEK